MIINLWKVKQFLHKILRFKYVDFIKYIFNKDYNSIEDTFLKFLNFIDFLKPFSRIFNSKTNKRIVCFGSMMGRGFVDNTKYLFFYLNPKRGFNCYWFTNSRDLFRIGERYFREKYNRWEGG